MFIHVQLFVIPEDCSPPGSSDHGTSQARILEWVAISFSGWEGVVVWSLPDPGIEPISPALASGFFTASATWEVLKLV